MTAALRERVRALNCTKPMPGFVKRADLYILLPCLGQKKTRCLVALSVLSAGVPKAVRYSLSSGSIAQSGFALLRSLYSSTFADFDKRNPRNDFPWKRQVCAIARSRR